MRVSRRFETEVVSSINHLRPPGPGRPANIFQAMSMRNSFSAPPPKATGSHRAFALGARDSEQLSFEERARLSANGAHGRRPAAASSSFGGRASHRSAAAASDDDEADFDDEDEDDQEGSGDDDEDEDDSDDNDDDEDGSAGAGRAQRAKAPGAFKKRTNKDRCDLAPRVSYQYKSATLLSANEFSHISNLFRFASF